MVSKYPIPTEWDIKQVVKRLPMVKANLISDLKLMGWKEKWIRHLIWYLRRREEIYTFQGIFKEI